MEIKPASKQDSIEINEFEDESDDDDDIGNEATDQIGEGVQEVVDSDEEWQEQQKVIAKLAPKLQSGKALTQDEMDEFGLDNDSDDGDSDYEFNSGDDAIYDSRLDEFDEL